MTWTLSEWNAFLTGLCFFLVFSGWSAMSNLATSTHGDVGAYCLAIVYLTLTITNLIAPHLISQFTPKYVMFYSSLTYSFCVASNIPDPPIPILLYISSLLVGFGAAMIWVSQQLFITQCSNHFEQQNNLSLNSKLGYFNGLFYMIYLFKKLIGNLIGALVLQIGASMSYMYAVLTVLCCIGSFGFCLLQPFPDKSDAFESPINKEETKNLLQDSDDDDQNDSNNDSKNDNNNYDGNDDNEKSDIIQTASANQITSSNNIANNENNANNPKRPGLCESVGIFMELWKDHTLWSLLPFTLYSGMDASFVSGIFPLFIVNPKYKFYIISYCGLMTCFFSMIFGKLSDKFGRLSILLIAAVCQSIVYLMCGMIDNDNYENIAIEILVIMATLIGLSGAGYMTQLGAIYPVLLGKKPEVFANLKFWQSLSMAIMFYVGSQINVHINAKACLSMLVIGFMPLVISYAKLILVSCHWLLGQYAKLECDQLSSVGLGYADDETCDVSNEEDITDLEFFSDQCFVYNQFGAFEIYAMLDSCVVDGVPLAFATFCDA